MVSLAALWIVPAILIVLVLGIAIICFYMAFYSKREKIREECPIPPGKVYESYREQMKSWMKEMRELPHDDVYIRSFDGLTLHGRYYEHTPGALTELMLHGYRRNAERDLYGGFRLEETSPLEAAKRCRLPVIFIHGEGDNFVPCDMSRENYNAKA